MQKDITTEKQNNGLFGEITIPSDKSISHRSLIFGALTGGKLKISNFSFGLDCRATLKIMEKIGCQTEFLDERTLILNAPKQISNPNTPLNCENSGTSMRLLSGFFAPQTGICATLIGDKSLSLRPMKRVIEPLELMGAKIHSNNFKCPLEIKGDKLNAITYKSKIASAQVKSCILLAGVKTDGITKTYEDTLSRNHSEKMFEYLGANIKTGHDENGYFTEIEKSKLEPKNIEIAGDISSAAFFMVMATIVPNSEIILKNVGLNPTRTGILDVLKMMKANVEILDKRTVSNEEVGDIKIKYTENLKGCEISGEIIPRLIDELPIISILATQANGKTTVKDAKDLRNKESDRIKTICEGLGKLGANIKENEDGFEIEGKTRLKGGVELDTYFDHRLAMSFFAAGLICEKPILIKDFYWVQTSFPEFLELFNKIS